MTLKMKLTASISAFVLIIGLMLMGVFAVNQATVNMGGSINFTATDVYARVTGKIENAQGEYADKELPPLEFSAENGTPDQSEWSGLNLLFDDDATPIVITVKVENLAKDRKLTASLTDNTAINENLVKDLKQDGVTYTSGTTKDLDASTGEGTSTTTYVVTFSIADHNKSLPQMDFELDIDLMDEGYEPPLEILEGFVFDNGVLTAYNGIATDVVIPNSYSIGYTEDEEMERNFSLDIVPDLAQTLTEMAIFSNWNYTDASGKSGVITYADMMGSGEDLQSLVFPLQVELDYKVTYSEYSETNLQMIQTFMTSFEELTSQGYISGGFYATVGENAKIYYANTADFDVDYPDISSAFPITLELENPISIEMYKNIKSFTFDPNAESDPNVLADLQMYLAMLPVSTWNYTDAKGNKGTLTMADFMGLTDNVTPISYPIDIEVTYNTTVPTATDENLELCMQLFSNYMQAFEEMKSAGYITGGFYATVNGQPRTLFNSTEKFVNFLMENYEGIDSDPNMFKQVFPMTFELENPVIIPGEQIFVEGNDIEVIGIDDATSSNNGVFYNSEITTIKLPSTLEFIGDYAFYNCSGLIEIDLSQCTSLTSIGVEAFRNCSGLTSITLPSRLTSIGERAFQGCSGLTSITIPSSLTTISQYAFYNCNGLESVSLPSSLTTISKYAFYNCNGLEELEYKGTMEQWLSINLDSSWISDGSHAFIVNGEELTSLEIPEYITVIPRAAFYGCSGLTGTLVIPEGVTDIEIQAFRSCNGLTSIILPLSLTSIGNSAFSRCDALETLEYKGTIEQWLSIGKGSTWISDGSHKFIVNGEELTNLIIPEGVTSIGNCAFYGCVDITSVTFPSSLRALMFDAFFHCDGLTEVDLSNCTRLNIIYSGVFENCTKLESIKLPSPKDWFYSNAIVSTSGTPMDMSDPQQNADWLTVLYRGYAGKIFHRNV